MVRNEVRKFILDNTRAISPVLCPEMKLRLITDECALWKAGGNDLKTMGLPDPYWGFAWAGGQALARLILDNPQVVLGKRVVDFGAGCGIELVAAMMAGASHGMAADIDDYAAEASLLNAEINNVTVQATTEDMTGNDAQGFDVLLAGDMFYDPAFSRRVIEWLKLLSASGVAVYLGDPNRGNLQGTGMTLVGTYMSPADVDVAGRYLRETKVFRIG
ncbi:MAG: 50S ribosomal protein L11 methyltransferase [Myxococcota bacterium]|jgi:predicted nicotinamide N-methyase